MPSPAPSGLKIRGIVPTEENPKVHGDVLERDGEQVLTATSTMEEIHQVLGSPPTVRNILFTDGQCKAALIYPGLEVFVDPPNNRFKLTLP